MAKPDRARVTICDAGPLIHLEELGCLDLLKDFDEVKVPEAVWQEIGKHCPTALRRRTLKLVRVRHLPEASPTLSKLTRALLLNTGEIDALKLMQNNAWAIFLTDDAAARLVAERLGFQVHGTIGIIVRALRRGQRTKKQVIKLLRAIPQRSTLFVEQGLLNSVIEKVEIADLSELEWD